MRAIIVHVAVGIGLIAAFLFVPAQTLHWPRAWILLGVLLVGQTWGIVRLQRIHPDLLQERMRSPVLGGQPGPDKILLPVFMATYAFFVAFVAADATRWHLLPPPPHWLSVLGLAAYALGLWGVHRVFLENRFAARVVRIQKERGHTVIDTGPYRWVRHPMYAFVSAMILGFTLWLGSTAGVLLSILPIGILALRILFEERHLREHLAGYREYTHRVRWRLVPGLW